MRQKHKYILKEQLKKNGWRLITTIILTFTAIVTFWVYAAFVEPSAGPNDSDQDFPQNILGANNNNNDFDSSLVTANSTGSIIERLEYLGEGLNTTECSESTTSTQTTCYVDDTARFLTTDLCNEAKENQCFVPTDNSYYAFGSECSDSTTTTRTNCYVDDTAKYVDADACSAGSNTGYCYMNTATFSAMDSDLAAGNILSGKTIFGITGTLPLTECTADDVIGTRCSGGIKFATGLVSMDGGCDGSTNKPICSGTDSVIKVWADSRAFNEPADSTTDGETNTINLVTYAPPANPAAQYCYDMVYGGYSDWYLPAKDQLNTLYSQRVTVGGFVSGPYWSSTEDSTPYAWYQSFNGGSQSYGYKDANTLSVRCIRSY